MIRAVYLQHDPIGTVRAQFPWVVYILGAGGAEGKRLHSAGSAIAKDEVIGYRSCTVCADAGGIVEGVWTPIRESCFFCRKGCACYCKSRCAG